VGLRELIQLNYCSDDESTGFLDIPKYPLEPQTAEISALGCFNLKGWMNRYNNRQQNV